MSKARGNHAACSCSLKAEYLLQLLERHCLVLELEQVRGVEDSSAPTSSFVLATKAKASASALCVRSDWSYLGSSSAKTLRGSFGHLWMPISGKMEQGLKQHSWAVKKRQP